jgi:hypothetical protein
MVKVAIVEGSHQEIESKDGAPALVAVKIHFVVLSPQSCNAEREVGV